MLFLSFYEVSPVVSLTDKGSSYGCYVGEDAIRSSAQSSQDDRIPKGESVILTKNVRVRFGLHSTIFKLIWQEPLIACTSTLSIGEKKRAISILANLEKGSKVIGDWSDAVNYLVMGEVILTIKVANALAKGVPIVTLNFFEDYMNCTKSKQMLPNPKNYIPKLKESTLNPNDVSLEANSQRKFLFKGKLLAFASKQQMAKFNVAIEYAGGKVVVVDIEKPDFNIFQSAENMLIQPDGNDELSTLWLKCIEKAERKGLKPIPEIQIGLAIITMNTVIYCNPATKRQLIANREKGLSTYIDSNNHIVLANETQLGKTQKRITQPPPEQTSTASNLNNTGTRKNIEETFIGPTPGESKSQTSVVQIDDNMTTPMDGNMDEHSNFFPQNEQSTEQDDILTFSERKSYKTIHEQNKSSDCRNLMKGLDQNHLKTNNNKKLEKDYNSLVRSPKRGDAAKGQKESLHIIEDDNGCESEEKLFDFDLDKPQINDSQSNHKKRKQKGLPVPEKHSSQKRQCLRGSVSDDKEFEADTFDFDLSPIKKNGEHDIKKHDKSLSIDDTTRNDCKRAIDLDKNDKDGNLSKKRKVFNDNKYSTSDVASTQSSQQSHIPMTITTPYGFIGKRLASNSLKSELSMKSSAQKYQSYEELVKVKIEGVEDNKSDALLEVSKRFVNLEVVSLVMKKSTEVSQTPKNSNRNTSKNVKKFKKQTFAQNGSRVQSRSMFIDLTMDGSGATSVLGSSKNSSSKRPSLWSENDQASQVEYEENNARNVAEEIEVDAFWNFQASQDTSQSFVKRNKQRTNVR